MILDLPLYLNNNNKDQCMQACMQMIVKKVLDKEISLDELDNITGREEDKWTYTPQMVKGLYELGVNIKFYSKEELEPFLTGEEYFRKHFGIHATKILEKTNMESLVESINTIINYNIFQKKKLELEDIENYLSRGNFIIAVIDYNKILRKENQIYMGHCVVLTGFDENHIYYNEPGPYKPGKNVKVPKVDLINAINSVGTDNDLVIVFGKKIN